METHEDGLNFGKLSLEIVELIAQYNATQRDALVVLDWVRNRLYDQKVHSPTD